MWESWETATQKKKAGHYSSRYWFNWCAKHNWDVCVLCESSHFGRSGCTWRKLLWWAPLGMHWQTQPFPIPGSSSITVAHICREHFPNIFSVESECWALGGWGLCVECEHWALGGLWGALCWVSAEPWIAVGSELISMHTREWRIHKKGFRAWYDSNERSSSHP